MRAAEAALEQARAAAPGVDGLPWQDYETDLDRRVEDLHSRVYRGAYRDSRPDAGIYRKRTEGSAHSRWPRIQHDALDALIVWDHQHQGELRTGRRHPLVFHAH